MRVGKFILLFQAIVTLVLGIIFFSQTLTIDVQKIIQSDITIDTYTAPQETPTQAESSQQKQNSAASYILLFVSLIELIIITRLLT